MHISEQVFSHLANSGWSIKISGEFRYATKAMKLSDAGMFSDGTRIAHIRIDNAGRWLEALDGFDVIADLDLREFNDASEAACTLINKAF